MEGYGYEQFVQSSVDYKRIVGDTQPPRNITSSIDGEHYVRQALRGHGLESAARRYSANRFQAALGPER